MSADLCDCGRPKGVEPHDGCSLWWNGADVTIRDGGSVLLFIAENDTARDWLSEHIDPDAGYQPFYPDAVVVEHRYAAALADGMAGDGLTLGKGAKADA